MKRWTSAVLFLVAIFVLVPACDSGDETDGNKPSDGDVDTSVDGDKSTANFGDLCVTMHDCPVGGDCITIGNASICTKTCTAKAECQADFPEGCCREVLGTYYCAPKTVCEATDGDAGDGDVTDEDKPATCTPDTYSCSEDWRKIIRCNGQKQWVEYQTCPESKYCNDGACGDNPPCDLSQMFCCPETYRCRENEVQKCDKHGVNWDFYRTCGDTEYCQDGVCKPGVQTDGDGETVEAEKDAEATGCTMADGCPDEDEYCFIKNTGDENGECRTFCDAGGSCPRGYKCARSRCVKIEGYCKVDGTCALNEFCNKLPGKDDGVCKKYCFEMGEVCPAHSRCQEDQAGPSGAFYGQCIYDECVPCNHDEACAIGEYCAIPLGINEGCCTQMCGTNNPCPGQLECSSDGRCLPPTGFCGCEGPCAAGYICDKTYCECALNCPPCGENQFCDATTAPNCKDGPCTNPIICGILLKQCCFGYRCSAIVYGVLGYCI